MCRRLLTLTALGGGLSAPAAAVAAASSPAAPYVIQIAWTGIPGAAGYRAYYGPAAGAETNSVELGPDTTAQLQLPRTGAGYLMVRAYDANGLESPDSNALQYTPQALMQVQGTGLQMSPALWPTAWVSTNSPWCVTNPTAAGFFRSQDPTGPTLTNWLLYPPQTPTYYVATNGASTNSGLSTTTPWPLSYALTNAPAGSTLILLPGTYTGACAINKPLTLRSQVKWAAQLTNLYSGVQIGYAGNASGTLLDGLEVAYSRVHGVGVRSSNCTVRNCWVHHSGRGNAGKQDGSGVVSTYQPNTVVEYCLLEYNGSTAHFDHGLYLGGSNLVVRNNVVRYNLAWGIQIWNNEGKPNTAQIYGNLSYGNGTGGNATGDPLIAYGLSGSLALFGNTFLSATGYGCQLGDSGTFTLTNNLFICSGPAMYVYAPATILAGYNRTNSTVAAAGFVIPASGLYWLAAGSGARGAALASVHGAVDFWGNALSTVSDVGAFQYSATYAADTRTLDPSSASGADYWAPLSTPLAAPMLWLVSVGP